VSDTPASKRPLSPHLQVYKPQLTSVLSISHRATGIFLSLGAWLLVVLVYGLAFDTELYNSVIGLGHTTLGALVLAAWAFSFYYHLCNGIRHLFWDAGRGFELKNVYASGYVVVLGAILLTLLTYGYVYYDASH
jgi:succinate dehydrogenase / fumarate reductase, cytochrome b subunit